MVPRRPALLVVVVALAALLAGCAAAGSPHTSALSPVPTRTGAPFSATLAGIRISLLRPAILAPKPNDKSANFLSFPSSANSNDFVRLLVPSTVCAAGAATPTAVPPDYVAYLHSLVPFGATIKDEQSISIDGVSGTELTLGGTGDIQGSIGQSQGEGCADENSFGVASDLSLRMAVFEVRNKTVLIWARTDANTPTAGWFDGFQRMLQTVTFG